MSQFTGVALCSISHLEWIGRNGKPFSGILLSPIAGKIPSKRILFPRFFSELDKSQDGETFVFSFYESRIIEEVGRQFSWTVIPFFKKSEFPKLIKDLGTPKIINVDYSTASQVNNEDTLEQAMTTYELEINFFKAKARQRHIDNAETMLDWDTERHEPQTNGYDRSDIYDAFDGDIDSMNEFLGNH